MPLKLEDVARMTGFSRSTVSRVINGDPNVKDSTRSAILEFIKQINFQPNMAARGLAAGRTNVLGLVIPMGVGVLFSDPFFPLFIQGVSSACYEKEYSVMLWLAEPEYERRTIRQILYNGLVDGVIVASAVTNDPIVEALAESNLPFILVGRQTTRQGIHIIDVENRGGAREVVSHLFECGYRRIATISGPQTLVAGFDRYQGYLDALRDHGQSANPDLIGSGDFSESGGYEAMRALIGRQPDAVFAASDTMAIGALRALREAGIRVPEDMGMAGFDDSPSAASSAPSLTTMRQPIHKLGVTAAEKIIDIIRTPPEQSIEIIIPVELIRRQSSACVV